MLNRSVGKRHLFGKDADFEAFQRVRIEAHQRQPIRILSYSLLSNHWHFAVWPDADGQVTALFRWLAHTQAMRWKVGHRTVGYGHLYQGRFQSFPVQSDEPLLTVLRYIERNAVGAGLVAGALALERPVGEDAWRRCDQDHLIALAGGTPSGLDRSRECAAEREGIRACAGEYREGPTFRRRRVG